MNFNELQAILQNLTNKKISLAEIGRILGLTRSNISKRAQSKSEVTVSELKKIEEHLGISIYQSGVYSGERQNDTAVDEKSSQFGLRLSELQAQHNFLDREMAQLLKISEKDYGRLVVNKIQPDLDILNRIKQNFKVSIDYLLYGE